MDSLTDIAVFTQVVDSGSFTAAAERLSLSKSVVSKYVTRLEDRLGARLLNRTTRRLSLTDSGRALHARASHILADLDDAEQAVTSAHGELRGRLRIAAPVSFGLQHLAPAVNAFLEAHKALTIDIDLNDRQINIVEEGFDMAVRAGYLEDSTLIARRLSSVRRVVVASPGYLAEHGTPTEPHELAQHWGLNYANMPRHLQWRFQTPQGKTITPQVPLRLQTNNGEMQISAAEAGLGITVLPTFICHQAITDGRLVPILCDYEQPAEGLYAVYPPGRFLTRRVRAFSEFLAGRFGDHPYWDDCLKDVHDQG